MLVLSSVSHSLYCFFCFCSCCGSFCGFCVIMFCFVGFKQLYSHLLSRLNKIGQQSIRRPIYYLPITLSSGTGLPPSLALPADPSLQPQFLPNKLSCCPSRGVSGLS